MARCPFAQWRPLGHTQPPAISRHDLVIAHTMGGNSLSGTDKGFHLDGYVGTEAHFGVGADGLIYQWVDTDHKADANVDANDRAISIETADAGGGFSKWSGSDVPKWTDEQIAALIKLITWCCDTHHIPKVMIPDSRSDRRGIGAHRQGINSSPAGQPGYRKPGTEVWSLSLGKVCPGDRRFAQLKTVVVPGVISPPSGPLEEAMQFYDTRAEFEQALVANTVGYNNDALSPKDVYGLILETHAFATALTPAAIAAAVVEALPPSSGGTAPTAEQIADAVAAKISTLLGGTS